METQGRVLRNPLEMTVKRVEFVAELDRDGRDRDIPWWDGGAFSREGPIQTRCRYVRACGGMNNRKPLEIVSHSMENCLVLEALEHFLEDWPRNSDGVRKLD